MKRIYIVQEIVQELLENHPETRNSDTELYVMLCSRVSPIVVNMPFATVLKNRESLGLPSIETVGRARRKLQEKRPDLRACKAVEDERYENYKRARAYALSE